MSVEKMIKVSGVALATLGLSTCSDNGAVDPAPPPFECPTSGAGGSLHAEALPPENGELVVSIGYSGISVASWKSLPQVADVTGATLSNVVFRDEVTKGAVNVVLQLADGATTGSFHITGTVTGEDGTDCPADRVFTFKITSAGVEVALRDDLPLGSKARASITLTGREGHEVELTAAGTTAGASLGWTATAGTVEPASEGRVRWRLPEEPGLYQIELLVDRGREGVHIDTLTLEVT